MLKKVGRVILHIVLFVIAYTVIQRPSGEFINVYLLGYIDPCQQNYVSFQILVATLIFIGCLLAIERKVPIYARDLFMASYFFFIMCISIFRVPMSVGHDMDLNLLNMFNDFRISIIIGNILLYLPVGFYISLRVKNKKLLHVFCAAFIIYDVGVEIAQHIMYTGFFDINDIILNSFGFFVGVFSSKYFSKLRTHLLTRRNDYNEKSKKIS